MTKIGIRMTGGLLVLLISAFLVYKLVMREGPADLSKARADFEMTAEDLWEAFSDDEQAATEKYAGKVVTLSGEVLEMEEDHWGQTLLTFVDPLMGITAVIDSVMSQKQAEQLSRIHPGSVLKLKGRCDGILMDVRLSKCLLLPIQ